ncbi:hypothetical protein B0J11DRAFT_583739 [Dendryphion nanum]|uniref:Uncharacterized protein n=1 Tax=Dendryphion nanum TaxID=256645 RepID=A0A9P9DCW9_9PLEO|nr:hypothetical protein B0J11DRAFT_583739 [Dendryphion nanum]
MSSSMSALTSFRPSPLPSNVVYSKDASMVKRMQTEVRYNRYYTLTTAQLPEAAWAPLKHHPEMETRPCHSSFSRTHLLSCGHVVVMQYGAEQCSGNCAGMETALVAAETARLDTVRKSIERNPNLEPIDLQNFSKRRVSPDEHRCLAVKVNQEFLYRLLPVGPALMQQPWAPAIVSRLNTFSQAVPLNIPHQRNLIDGDFQCLRCKQQGLRITFPGHIHYPSNLVIVERCQEDTDLVNAIKTGFNPENTYEIMKRHGLILRANHGVYHGGRGGHQAGRGGAGRGPYPTAGPGMGSSVARSRSTYRQVRDGRIEKYRRDEKQRVLNEIAAETLVEDLGRVKISLSTDTEHRDEDVMDLIDL